MKPVLKYPLIVLGVLAVTAPVLYVIAVSIAIRAHYDEDRIVLTIQVSVLTIDTCGGVGRGYPATASQRWPVIVV